MLAIVIVSYKSNKRTASYILQELPKIKMPNKVVVVNNGAGEGESEELAAAVGGYVYRVGDSVHFSDDIKYFVIDNPENSGYARGNNIGARFAIDSLGAELILFTNNDIRFLDNDVADRLATVLETVPQAGIAGPRIVGMDGRLQSPEPYISFARRHIWMYLCTPFLSKEAKARRFLFNYSETAEEGFHYKLMGSFFMVRAADFERCGMMDEGTFLYSEEPILTERMASIGLRPYYCPAVSVLHEHGATISQAYNRKKQDSLQFESEVYYYRKYKSVSYIQVLVARLIRKFLYLLKY